VQIHREHNLLALNFRLKYEIQVPNTGQPNALYPQPDYWGFMAPESPIAPPCLGGSD